MLIENEFCKTLKFQRFSPMKIQMEKNCKKYGVVCRGLAYYLLF